MTPVGAGLPRGAGCGQMLTPIGDRPDGVAAAGGEGVPMIFENRRDAGRKLADLLRHVEPENPIVLALPRGGVPVAAEVARVLGAPMDLLAVRKLGAPQNPEFGIGAVAEDGTAVMDTTTARQIGVTEKEFERILERESRELRRRMELFRDGLPPADLHGRTVIVVDDGMATGLTDLAAVRARAEARRAEDRGGGAGGLAAGGGDASHDGRRGGLPHDPPTVRRRRGRIPRLLRGVRRRGAGGDRRAPAGGVRGGLASARPAARRGAGDRYRRPAPACATSRSHPTPRAW